MYKNIFSIAMVFVLFGVVTQSAMASLPTAPSVSESIQKQIKDAQLNTQFIEKINQANSTPKFHLKNPEQDAVIKDDSVRFLWSPLQPTDPDMAYYVITLRKVVGPGVTDDVFALHANKTTTQFQPTDKLSPGTYEWFMSAMRSDKSVIYATEKVTFDIVPAEGVLGTPPSDPTADPTTNPTEDPTSETSGTEHVDATATNDESDAHRPTVPSGQQTATDTATNAPAKTNDLAEKDQPSKTDPTTTDTAIQNQHTTDATSTSNLLWWILGVVAVGALAGVMYTLGAHRSKEEIISDNDVTPAPAEAPETPSEAEASKTDADTTDHKD